METQMSDEILDIEKDDEADVAAVVPPQFEVRDESTANWLVRRVVECRAYAERCAAWAEAERRRAERDEEFLLFRFGGQLAEFARQQIAAAGGRRKSITLPAGTAGFRTLPARVVVDDEAAALARAKQHTPHLVTVVERLSRSGLIDHVKQTGEMPPRGVHTEPAREGFYVK
jgi:hypothetical protein